MYKSLQPDKIITNTTGIVEQVKNDFPDRTLAKVANEVEQIARHCEEVKAQIIKPNWFLMALKVFFVVSFALSIIQAVRNINFARDEIMAHPEDHISEIIPVAEAGLNIVVVMGAGLYFVMSIQSRLNQKQALRAIREIRSIAHVIDMNQLNKDPDMLLRQRLGLSDSTDMDAVAMSHYLDYCSELLSCLGKIAAYYVQNFDDAVVLNAVNEVENLVSGITEKIWLKITIIHQSIA